MLRAWGASWSLLCPGWRMRFWHGHLLVAAVGVFVGDENSVELRLSWILVEQGPPQLFHAENAPLAIRTRLALPVEPRDFTKRLSHAQDSLAHPNSFPPHSRRGNHARRRPSREPAAWNGQFRPVLARIIHHHRPTGGHLQTDRLMSTEEWRARSIVMETLGGFPNLPATLRCRRSRQASHAIA